MLSSTTKNQALVLDIGTTGIKALVFDRSGQIIFKSYRAIGKEISHNGLWVEQDPLEMVKLSIEVLQEATKRAGVTPATCCGLGITNQRETVVLWNKETGEPVYKAVVWEDARTTDLCQEIKEKYGTEIREATGLTVDTYFSASKIKWVLEYLNLPADFPLAVGTVDSWLVFNLVKGRPHLTDYTNASRTLLFDIHKKTWSERLASYWNITTDILPVAQPSLSNFGDLDENILGYSLPVVASCGDQQASLYAATKRGADTKVTYGTGTFLLQSIGKFILKENFFTTLSAEGYALEAKVGTYGKRTEALLEAGQPLRPLVEEMTLATATYLKKLPFTPTKVILDGGITQAADLLPLQTEAAPDLEFEVQEPFDGTALGIAQMVFDAEVS